MFPTVHGVVNQGGANWYDGAYAAWQAKGAASLAASYLDLTGNGRNLTVGVAPTWDAVNGWIGSSTAYLRTGIIPQPSWTVIASISNAGGFYHDPFGTLVTPPNAYLWSVVNSSGFNSNTIFNGTSAVVSPATLSGVIAIAGETIYINGALVATLAVNVSTITLPLFLLASNSGGGANRNFRGNMQMVGMWNTKLDGATIAEKTAQIQAL